MKSELLVTAGQHTAVNMFPGLVHTARHVMGVSNTRSRWANRKEAAVEGGTSDWDEVVNLLRPLAGNGKRQKFGYLLEHPMNPTVLPITTTQVAGDQMEVTNRSVRKISREVGDEGLLTPQRLHAELLVTGSTRLESYLQGALRDATRSAAHKTHRYGQSDRAWLETLQSILGVLGHRSWIYREGKDRNFWVLETSAKFLSIQFDASQLVGLESGLDYVRGYFDADGGMPRDSRSRLYIQYCQNDRSSLETVKRILDDWGIECGRTHNPSIRVDPDYWRFFIRANSHSRFFELVSSWHPRKRAQIAARTKI